MSILLKDSDWEDKVDNQVQVQEETKQEHEQLGPPSYPSHQPRPRETHNDNNLSNNDDDESTQSPDQIDDYVDSRRWGVFRVYPRINENNTVSPTQQEIPHAYPVMHNFESNHNNDTSDNNGNEDEDASPTVSVKLEASKCFEKYECFIISLLVSALSVGAMTYFVKLLLLPSVGERNSEIAKNVTNITPEFDDENFVIIHTPVASNSTSDNSSEVNLTYTEEPDCFTDPLMIQHYETLAYERKDDPSTPRTYHICPNTVLNIFPFNPRNFAYDYTGGDVFPLYIFRPNISILCGPDGDIDNNCTFQGGTFHIMVVNRSLQRGYEMNTTAHNVTIEGMKFTGANEGSNVLIRMDEASVTLKNCRFSNNHEMQSIVGLFYWEKAISLSLNIDNCIFENNLLKRSWDFNINPGELKVIGSYKAMSTPVIGVVASYIMSEWDAMVEISLRNSTFFNNSMLLSEGQMHRMSAAVVNVLVPVKRLSIVDSCFLKNKGYSSGVVMTSSDNDLTSFEYLRNQFLLNEPNELNTEDYRCIVNLQEYTEAVRDVSVANMTFMKGCHDHLMNEQDDVCSRFTTLPQD